jgi:uncharacterized protein YciI
MRILKYFWAPVVVGIFFAGAFGQETVKKDTPTYDAELAKHLGGNDNGMKGYIFVMLRTGPKDGDFKGKDREDLFAGHMANIGRMADMGKLIVAGPFDKNDRGYRGVFIFNVATVEEAQKLVETDPTIKAGILVADIVPWWATAALMAIPEIHPKIMKPKP